jgi:hypothetical protein
MSQPNPQLVPVRMWVGMFGGLLLTACPLTDRYYIEQDSAGASSASEGGIAGRASTTAFSGSAGVGGSGTGGAPLVVDCDVATCGGTCCNNICVDLQTDAANCSQCGSVCPAGRFCRSGVCYGWTPMAVAPTELVAREKAAYTVMGSKLFIFGGLDAQGNALNSGAIYDKTTDSWTMLPQTAGVPSPRQLATAVWTGVRVYVALGTNSASTLTYSDTARWDPSTNAWTTLPPMPVPVGYAAPWGAFSPSYLLLWGGLTAAGPPVSGGARFAFGTVIVPGSATAGWTTIASSASTPQSVSEAAWAFSTDSAFLFGGRVNGTTSTNKGYLFSYATSAWSPLVAGPTARWGAFVASDGTNYYLWGGRDDTVTLDDGHQYATSWTSLGAVGAPSPRWAPNRRTGWAFAFGAGDIAIIGGMDVSGNPLTDGGRYVRATDSWTTIMAWPSYEAHEYGVAGLIDGEIFIWGGRNGATVTATGERFLP